MEKCRVVIADEELEYLLRLQRCFLEAYRDTIDLEVIQSKSYFQSLFSTPQQISVLIVSEKFYSPELQMHTIGQLYILVEESEDSQSPDRTYIHKYTSTREVFAKINGSCRKILSIDHPRPARNEVILISSACGGSGKTTTALALSAALSRKSLRVLYINADYLQTFRYCLNDTDCIKNSGFYSRVTTPEALRFEHVRPVLRSQGFSYLPSFRGPLLSIGIPFSIFPSIISAAKSSGEFDYIIVDSHMEFTADKVHLMSMADKVILLTNQSRSSVLSTDLLCSNISDIRSGKYMFVCSQFCREQPDHLKRMAPHLRFTVSHYISQVPRCEELGFEELAGSEDIQSLALLLL